MPTRNAIDIFPWDDNFNTGLPVVDEQHRKLVELLNSLASHVAFKTDEFSLDIILEELIDYTDYHFKTEEAIWHQYFHDDSNESEHLKTHEGFVSAIRRRKMEQERQQSDTGAEDLLDFLVRWLAAHILESDRHMAHMVLAMQQGMELDAAQSYAKEKMGGSNRVMIDIILSIYATLSRNTLYLMRELVEQRRVEKELYTARQNTEKILDAASQVAIVATDRDGLISMWNSGAENMLGYSAADLVGKQSIEKLHVKSEVEAHAKKLGLEFGQNLQGFDVFVARARISSHEKKEWTFVRRDGSLLSVDLIFTAVRDDEGQITGYLGVAQDITERKQSEERRQAVILELEHERSFLKTLINTLPELVWLKDPEGVYLACNPEFELFFGAKETQIVGKTDYDFVNKKLADFFREHDRKAMAKGKPSSNQEWITYASDGRQVLLETTKTPMYSSQGELIGVLGIAHDITKERKLQQGLRAERDLNQRYLDTMDTIMVSLDKQGLITMINRKGCELLGYGEEELLGQQWFERCLQQPEGMEEVYPVFLEIMSNRLEGVEYFENNILNCNGEIRLIAWHNAYLHTEGGEIAGTLSAGEDITEKRRIEQELERSERYHRTVLNNFPFMVWLKDTESRLLAVNQPFAEVCGFDSTEELKGKTDFDLWPREFAESYRDDDREVLQSGKAKNIEELIESPSGRSWFETFKSPVELDGKVIGTVGFSREITDRKEAEDKLKQSASVFEHANEGILITDIKGKILDVNNAFTQITGYTRQEVLGQNPRILKSGRHGRDFYRTMWEKLEAHGQWSNEIWNRRKDGSLYATMQTISSVTDEAGNTNRYVSLFSDITSLKEHQYHIEHIAHYDPLTDLPNRTLLTDRLRQGLKQAQRHDKSVGVVYLDLDGFKVVNDTYGHDTGDRLLTFVAARMKDALRDGDTLARFGGDEFVAVLNDIQNQKDSTLVLLRLLDAVAEPVFVDKLELRVTASIGVSFFPQAETVDGDQLIRQADQAMYMAKQAGKNRYHIFDAEYDQEVRGRRVEVERIREALDKEEFVLHYQPKVDMRSSKVVGAEALIRWQHPERGLLPPATFLPAIANESLSISVGDWVIETAAKQVEIWRKMGADIPVSVNVDALQFAQPDFLDKLSACLARHPTLKRGDLELEVLENNALDDISRVREVIIACDKMGVGFALDDFGTGYSTLIYLKRLPARLLKIDQGFVRDMLKDPEDLAILDGVLGLADAFQREAMAEGVETKEHGSMLLSLGCRLAQGYGIARPMPAESLPEWIKTWRADPAWSKRPRVSADDLPVLFSMVEHRAWLERLSSYLTEDGKEPPHLDPHQCRFGQWLDNRGRERYAEHSAIMRIEELHMKVHRQAHKLLDYKKAKKHQKVLEGFSEIEETADQLLKHMESLVYHNSL